ncbi:MAG: ligase-associated DNA damage response DEXH box helicase [Ignavibacteria bacterium]
MLKEISEVTSTDRKIEDWFTSKGWTPFEFQREVWQLYAKGYDGILNAPTGSGKTYAMWYAVIAEHLNADTKKKKRKNEGLKLLWITPLKALSKDIERALKESASDLGIQWKISTRTGDTSASVKAKQKKNEYQVLITTPESLHLMIAGKQHEKFFEELLCVVVDEWHELMGSKRGVQVELGLSRIKAVNKKVRVWGVSATIGNLKDSLTVLLGPGKGKRKIVKAKIEKKISITSLLPDEVEKFPWAGHLGIKMLHKVVPIIKQSGSTLIFTNTRSQSEIWYQKILEHYPEFAGTIALHHGSIDRKIRDWVESNLHKGKLKAVVCTSSLDLGVDFYPVDTVIQIGSPKGVSRFLQRAGRSGHRPDAMSRIYFVPTHSLELIEGAALKQAIETNYLEERQPVIKPIDVLIQYAFTLAAGDGLDPQKAFEEVKKTFSYSDLREDEWNWIMRFVISGGDTLKNYDEYSKVELVDGRYRITDRRKSLFHKLSIGTIVSEMSMLVKYMSGGTLGSVEEDFIAAMRPGDVFTFAGKNLELADIREITAYVRKTKRKSSRVPSWLGGRMPLSSQLSELLRVKLGESVKDNVKEIELETIRPIVKLQSERSHVPGKNELLIESFESEEGHHLFFYPFEGRLAHEGLAALCGYRIAKLKPLTFSFAMNDYGFELLCDSDIPLRQAITNGLFSSELLEHDIMQSINSSELAKRRFRQIARISGLIFQGYPGKYKTNKNLQASSELLFEVFSKYEPENLLLKQAYDEMLQYQLEYFRIRTALDRIAKQKVVIKDLERPSPFSFPILVDRMREKITTEKLEDRVRKMQLRYEQG